MRMRAILHGGRQLALAGCLGAAVAGAALGQAALEEVTISFDGATMEGLDAAAPTPDVAHLVLAPDLPDEDGAPPAGHQELPPSREERILDTALELGLIRKVGDRAEGTAERYSYPDRGTRLATGREAVLEVLRKFPDVADELEYKISRARPGWKTAVEPAAPLGRAPSSPLQFAPGQAIAANPSFVEHGFRVEAFWAARTGTPRASFVLAHFHPPNLSTGFEAQHLGGRNELHGVHIRSTDGRAFWVKRLRYRPTRNRQLPTKAHSIEGFSNFSVNILVARAFDPRRRVKEQFMAFPVGMAVGNEQTLPWQTVHLWGFEYVQEVYIASSASVDIDDIAIVRLDATR